MWEGRQKFSGVGPDPPLAPPLWVSIVYYLVPTLSTPSLNETENEWLINHKCKIRFFVFNFRYYNRVYWYFKTILFHNNYKHTSTRIHRGIDMNLPSLSSTIYIITMFIRYHNIASGWRLLQQFVNLHFTYTATQAD